MATLILFWLPRFQICRLLIWLPVCVCCADAKSHRAKMYNAGNRAGIEIEKVYGCRSAVLPARSRATAATSAAAAMAAG